MWAYIVRRIFWTVPTVLGVVLLTFTLFSLVSRDPARQYAGKFVSEEVLQSIRHKMGVDKPAFLNFAAARQRGVAGLLDSQFFDVLLFRFPESMRYEQPVWSIFARKIPVSLAIQVPVFVVALGLELGLALICAAGRGRWPDYTITVLAVVGLSLPALSIYLAAQWFFGAYLELFPVAGWDTGAGAVRFAALPILVSVVASLGGGTRFYRTVAVDEIYSDYVRTARAKGVAEREVLLTHVLRNVLIPVITNTLASLPALVLGALFLERIFQIPGMGGLIVEAIFNQDRPVVMAAVYVISVAYCIMLLITDICYALVDPRVSLR